MAVEQIFGHVFHWIDEQSMGRKRRGLIYLITRVQETYGKA